MICKELSNKINPVIECFPVTNIDEFQKPENKELLELRNKAKRYLNIGMTYLDEKYMDQFKEKAIIEICEQKHINLFISQRGSFTNHKGKTIYDRCDLKEYKHDVEDEILPYIEKATALFSPEKLQIWKKSRSLDPLLILFLGIYNPDYSYYYIELMRWE
jgi:ribosome biogenesis GTPase A